MNKQIIELLLDEKRMTQAELAEKINVTAATLSRNLNGINPPKAELVKSIADYFDVSVDYLLGRTTKRKNDNSNDIPINEIQLALFEEIKEFSDEQISDLIKMAQIVKKISKQ